MRTLMLTIAYDGTAYSGWQSQPDRPTVQEAIEKAIKKTTGETTRILGSSRTDAGVHALGQVASWRTESRLPASAVARALNSRLPSDIAILDAREVTESFHPIRGAIGKHYRYTIHDGPMRDVFLRHYCWHYPFGRLDAEAMDRAAKRLLGTHDFRGFENTGAPRASTVRTLREISVRREPAGQGRAGEGDVVVLEVEGNGFLYNMVRTLVGTLVEVGRGAQGEGWPINVVQSADRTLAGQTAPPQGLVLVDVRYPPEIDGAGQGGALPSDRVAT